MLWLLLSLLIDSLLFSFLTFITTSSIMTRQTSLITCLNLLLFLPMISLFTKQKINRFSLFRMDIFQKVILKQLTLHITWLFFRLNLLSKWSFRWCFNLVPCEYRLSCFYFTSLASFFIFLIDHLFFYSSFSHQNIFSSIKYRSCMWTKHLIILIVFHLFFLNLTFLWICFEIHEWASTTFICIPIIILIISAQQAADIFSSIFKFLTGRIIILVIIYDFWIEYISLFFLRLLCTKWL